MCVCFHDECNRGGQRSLRRLIRTSHLQTNLEASCCSGRRRRRRVWACRRGCASCAAAALTRCLTELESTRGVGSIGWSISAGHSVSTTSLQQHVSRPHSSTPKGLIAACCEASRGRGCGLAAEAESRLTRGGGVPNELDSWRRGQA